MKKYLSFLLILPMLFACTKGNDTPDEKTIPYGAVDLGIVINRGDGTSYKLCWAKSNIRRAGVDPDIEVPEDAIAEGVVYNSLCAYPEQYGDYYAWGDIEAFLLTVDPATWTNSKTDGYTWANYKWCNGTSSTLKKYNTNSEYGNVDDKMDLQDYNLEDDAARYIGLKGNWRLPTPEEANALINQCTWEWGSLKGVSGYFVRSKVEGNSNYIFLPSSGIVAGNDLSYAKSKNGSGHGFFWTSKIQKNSPWNAQYFGFQAEKKPGVFSTERRHGCSIRPVCIVE